MFSRIGAKAIKLDLTKTQALCVQLKQPQRRFKSIHVAGTNGKGSVSHMLAAIFQKNGYRTGLYTSPHLRDFRERIRINGEMIPEQYVIDFTERNRKFIESLNPSFFELTFGMAAEYFAIEKVDIAIIETGLGGRLDSTNVIRPELSIITNIGFDHTDILGDTLEKIAEEKAGIIKSTIPAIIGEKQPETSAVFLEKGKRISSPVVFADQIYRAKNTVLQTDYLETEIEDMITAQTVKVKTDLAGMYQTKNLIIVFAATKILKNKWKLDDQKSIEALAEVRRLTGFRGRWQILQRKPLTIMDVAHNAAGVMQVMEQLAHTAYEKLHIVIGTVRDKEVEPVLKLLPAKAHYYFTNAHIPRAMPADELRKRAELFCLHGSTYENVNAAIRKAQSNAAENDLILIVGSVFVVGEIDENFAEISA